MHATLRTVLILLLTQSLDQSPSPRPADDEMRPLFNDTDLTGWVRVNCAADTFRVRDRMIVTTGAPMGFLRTDRQYENFIVELEWKHLKEQGNSGFFVWSDALPGVGSPFSRAIEVQILDGRNTENYTSHGDLFSIQGAVCKPDRPHPKGWMRCLPSERRSNPAGQWNHYRIECKDGAIKLAVNGKVVSGISQCKPRKGYLCLESEGSECHFRNLRIKELPSTNPKPEEVAEADQGFHSLYTGLDLTGWKQDAGQRTAWHPKDWILSYTGTGDTPGKHLQTEKEYGDFQLRCDWRLPAKPGKQQQPDAKDGIDSGIALRGSSKLEVAISDGPVGSGTVRGSAMPMMKADKPPGQWNRFLITLKGDRLTVDLNGHVIVDNARLTDVPQRGPIVLRAQGSIEFANLFLRTLE